MNHVGNQQNRPDGLHQRDGEGGVAKTVQHGKKPVDQLLLIKDPLHSRLIPHRVVKFRVLLGVVQFDDE